MESRSNSPLSRPVNSKLVDALNLPLKSYITTVTQGQSINNNLDILIA